MTIFAAVAAAHYIFTNTPFMNQCTESDVDAVSNSDPSDISLPALLGDKIGFELFLEHMIKEYSSEHILFLVELLQIKHLYQLQHGNQLKLSFVGINAVVDFEEESAENSCISSYFFKPDGDLSGALRIPASGKLAVRFGMFCVSIECALYTIKGRMG